MKRPAKCMFFVFYPVYDNFFHLWTIIWYNLSCRMILYWNSRVLVDIIRKESAVWLVRQARMFWPMGLL